MNVDLSKMHILYCAHYPKDRRTYTTKQEVLSKTPSITKRIGENALSLEGLLCLNILPQRISLQPCYQLQNLLQRQFRCLLECQYQQQIYSKCLPHLEGGGDILFFEKCFGVVISFSDFSSTIVICAPTSKGRYWQI